MRTRLADCVSNFFLSPFEVVDGTQSIHHPAQKIVIEILRNMNLQTLFSISPVFSVFFFLFRITLFHGTFCCLAFSFCHLLCISSRWSSPLVGRSTLIAVDDTSIIQYIYFNVVFSARARAGIRVFSSVCLPFYCQCSRSTQLNVKISRSELRWIYSSDRGHRCHRHRRRCCCCYVC